MAISEGATNYVSNETHDVIGNYVKDATQSASEIQANLNQELDNNPFASTEGVGFRGQMGEGVDNKTLSEAIDQRAMRGYRAEQSEMRGNIQMSALEARLSRLKNAAQLVNAEMKMNERADLNRYIQRQNRKAKRAGVLGNVLGIAGAAGGAMVGGPAGAMVGYQIGQGTGRSVGY